MTPSLLTRISYHIHPPVARITLHNPPLNVIDIPMMEELAMTIGDAEARDDLTTILFSGSDKVFSAGVDVAAHTPDKIEEMFAKFHAIFHALIASRKVLVATVHGHCLGGGAELANSAVPDHQVKDKLDQLLERLSKLSPAALATTKKALYTWHAMHFDKGLGRSEKIYLEELMKTEDAREGIRAFMEKREPQWKGK